MPLPPPPPHTHTTTTTTCPCPRQASIRTGRDEDNRVQLRPGLRLCSEGEDAHPNQATLETVQDAYRALGGPGEGPAANGFVESTVKKDK